MRFQITLNMPSYGGSAVHQVICEHPVASLAAFAEEINGVDFVVLDELYKDGATGGLHVEHQIVINTALIGKVKIYQEKRR